MLLLFCFALLPISKKLLHLNETLNPLSMHIFSQNKLTSIDCLLLTLTPPRPIFETNFILGCPDSDTKLETLV